MDNGIYVVIKDSTYILDKIHTLSSKYNRDISFSGRYEDARKSLRCYCHETSCLINECFETSLLGSGVWPKPALKDTNIEYWLIEN